MAFTFCAIKMLTGLDCPACGLGHSILELLRGNFLESVAWHPMGVVLALAGMSWPWWRGSSLSEVGRKILSHVFLLGFFVPWSVRVIASVSEAIRM